jgi:galactokinase
VNRAGPPDAARWFAERYGREPEGVWFAPGRVNLIGGPDYNEVFVLPFALGAGVFAAASRRSDRLAALARRAENDFAGVPTGIMDQIAAMLGKAGHALLLDCRSGTETAVPLDPAAAGLTLLVIDTRARHALADGHYASRRQACEQAASLLGVRSLRDVTGDPGALAGLTELVPADRADQVCQAVTRRFTQNHWPAPHFLDAVPSDGARRIGSALG